MNVTRSLYNKVGASAATIGLVLGGAATVKAGAGQFALPTPGGGSNFSNNRGSLTNSLPGLVTQVLSIVLLITGILAVFYLIWSGIQYITSGGNPDKVKVARAGIINAIIGIVIILSAYFIIRFAVGIGNTIGGQSGAL